MNDMGIAGFVRGDSVTVGVTQGGTTESATAASWERPAKAAIPFISGVFRNGETLTADTSHLTNVGTIEWYHEGVGTALSTGSTYSATMMADMGKHLYISVDVDGETIVSPATSFLHDHATARHNDELDSFIALVPHSDTTHLAVADGDWSAPTTWHNGEVPGKGAVALIPHGRTVLYDETRENIQLDRMRVDGTLNLDITQTCQRFVETLLVSTAGLLNDGTLQNPLPADKTFIHLVAGQDYSTMDTDNPSLLGFARDRELLGRGIVNCGTWNRIGAQTMGHVPCQWGMAPEIGDTSVTIRSNGIPTGWAVGDEIHIPHTTPFFLCFNNGLLEQHGEDRVITAITDNSDGTVTISFSGGLVYDHKPSNTSVVRKDLVPNIANTTRNIVYQGTRLEPSAQRGHTIDVHGSSGDSRWCTYADLGRTQKNIPIGASMGDIDADGDIDFSGKISGQNIVRALQNGDNIIGRYPMHAHHAPCHYQGNVVLRSPGWGISHHSTFANIFGNVVIDVQGAGIIAEQGDETGPWINNYVANLPQYTNGYLGKFEGVAKGQNQPEMLFGSHANAYVFRSRKIVASGNHAYGGAVQNIFPHRASPDPSPRKFMARSELDISGITLNNDDLDSDRWPILNFVENVMIGGRLGFESWKSTQDQSHHVWNTISRCLIWDCARGCDPQYVSRYGFEQMDVTGPSGKGELGLSMGHNASYGTWVQSRIHGFEAGVHGSGRDDAGGSHPTGYKYFDADEDPFRAVVDVDFYDCDDDIVYGLSFRHPGEATSSVNADGLTYPATETLPHLGGARKLGACQINSDAAGTQETVHLNDTLSTALGSTTGMPFPTALDPGGLLVTESQSALRKHVADFGYYQIDGVNAAVFPVFVSDRLTFKTQKFTCWIELTSGSNLSVYTDNGAFVFSDDAPVLANATPTLTVAAGGSVTYNPTTGATHGGDGGAITPVIALEPDHKKPSKCAIDINTSTGVVTWTPYPGVKGVDQTHLWVGDGHGNHTLCFVRIEIDCSTAQAIPDAALTITGGAGQITFQLDDMPDSGNRFIERLDYTTDGGTTWRRLSHCSPLDVFPVTVASDGTALAAGSYSCGMRYKPDNAAETASTTFVNITVT